MTYTITGAETGVPFSDGIGNNGLPIILSDNGNSLTINGNGATIERDPALFADPMDPCSGPGLLSEIIVSALPELKIPPPGLSAVLPDIVLLVIVTFP